MPEPSLPFVDLLGGPARLRVNKAGLRQALTFAFSAGGSQDALAHALAEAARESSLWAKECFADDLFLGALIERVLWRSRAAARSSASVGVRRYVLSILSSPPAGLQSLEVVRYRQGISAELMADTTLSGHAAGMVQRIEALFELLEAGGVGVRLDPTRRGLDILGALKRVVDEGAHFTQAKSGLSAIAAWSGATRDSPEYQRVLDLLDYDGHAATVHLDVRLGRQGELRGMQIVRIAENTQNPFYVSVWRRLWGVISLSSRGFRLRRAEVFSRLVHDVFEGMLGAFSAILQLLGDLEFYRLGLALGSAAREQGLEVCLPSFVTSGRRIDALFNPFLLLEERPPRPCDISNGPGALVVITGPNSGGKTRLLQALGMCQVLAQAGLFVPARAAALPWQDGLFASLSVQPGAEQREGRLGTELLRIRSMFEKLEVGALVLVDELCSGTNPGEAEELFGMVLDLLAALSAEAFVTTHFLEFAARLALDPPVSVLEFLRVGLDADKRPTYHFEPGVAESALAQQTAQRLGVTQHELSALVHAARERKRLRG